ncbi:unnamed protein product, partial [Adineta steineri]
MNICNESMKFSSKDFLYNQCESSNNEQILNTSDSQPSSNDQSINEEII